MVKTGHTSKKIKAPFEPLAPLITPIPLETKAVLGDYQHLTPALISHWPVGSCTPTLAACATTGLAPSPNPECAQNTWGRADNLVTHPSVSRLPSK